MCQSCYDSYTEGRTVEVTPYMEQTTELIKQLYSRSWGLSGGPMHVTLDDMNLDDRMFDANHRLLLERCGNGREIDFYGADHSHFYTDLTPADWELVLTIFDRLASMTTAQRAETVWRAHT